MNKLYRSALFLVPLLLPWAQLAAQTPSEPPNELDSFVRAQQSKLAPTISACGVLAMAGTIEGAFNEKQKELWKLKSSLTDHEDGVWDHLIDCANQAKSADERTEALRLVAMWERLRSEAFEKLYRASIPLSTSACADLGKIYVIVKRSGSGDAKVPNGAPTSVRKALIDCMNESYRLNQDRPRSQEADSAEYLVVWTEKSRDDMIARYNALATEHNQLIEDANDLVARYNLLADDYEKQRSLALQAIHANESYVRSMERIALFQSTQAQRVSCEGTSYSYGKWGTFTMQCQ